MSDDELMARIARRLHSLCGCEDGSSEDNYQEAYVLLPLVKQAQAEALREVADSRQAKMFSPAVYLGPERRRFAIEATEWLHREADRIENVRGNRG